MKKNVPNLQRAKRDHVPPVGGDMDVSWRSLNAESPARHRRRFTEIIDIEHLTAHASHEPTGSIEQAKPTNVSLKDILMQYGLSQYCCGIVGGFAVTPSVAASGTMYVVSVQLLGIALRFGFLFSKASPIDRFSLLAPSRTPRSASWFGSPFLILLFNG